MVAINNYPTEKPFPSLSVTSLNDVKTVSTNLKKANFGVENVFENIESADHFHGIVDAYVDALNKSEEELGKPECFSMVVVPDP